MRCTGVVVFLLLAVSTSWAQFKQNKSQGQGSNSTSLMDKLYFAGGGNLGSGTSSNGYRYSYFSLFPTVGYKVQPNFIVGVNLSYSRYSFPDALPPLRSSYTQIGYAPFIRYQIQQLFFQLEYDQINSTTLDSSQPSKTYERLLVGVGYRMPLGQRSAINALAMYDVLYQSAGPFLSPFVYRVFFSF